MPRVNRHARLQQMRAKILQCCELWQCSADSKDSMSAASKACQRHTRLEHMRTQILQSFVRPLEILACSSCSSSCVSIRPFVLVTCESSGNTRLQLLRQYSSFCTSSASKLTGANAHADSAVLCGELWKYSPRARSQARMCGKCRKCWMWSKPGLPAGGVRVAMRAAAGKRK